jgi:MGT family glycosyltransferase
MSNILVASTPLLGHVAPMLLAAKFLQQQGHQVSFLTGEVFRERVETSGLSFLPLSGRANYDWRNLHQMFTEEEAAAVGLDAHIIHLKRFFADSIHDQYSSLELAIQQHRPDAILIDVLFMGSLPLLLGDKDKWPPVISCGVIAPMWRDAGFSPFAGADLTPEGQIRNIEDGHTFDSAVRPGTLYVDQILQGLGVAIPGGFRMFDSLYRLPDVFLQFCAKDFEYPLVEKRKNLHFVGPILPKSSTDLHAPTWLDQLTDSKPIILVTQGTLANTNFDELINPTIAALVNEDVQVIATAGGGDQKAITKANNVIVERYVPYEMVLPRSSVFVTNGGYNGVQQALSFGVPVISAGSTEDKPYVSARVAWSGTGLNLKTGNPTSEQIRDAVRQLIAETKFRERAHELSVSISQTDALKTIADLVNSEIGVRAAQRKKEK